MILTHKKDFCEKNGLHFLVDDWQFDYITKLQKKKKKEKKRPIGSQFIYLFINKKR
jgi:hypothetical protein